MADRGYQLVIGANFVGKTYAYLYLDTCMEKDITSSAHIPTQPLQDGNTIADHMYRNPDEYTISGVFSLYGKYGNDKRYDNMPIISDQGDRLGNIQSVFEYIKDNGILCDLTTIQEDDYGTVRFKQRNNMALENIRWKENQASMNYTFTFKEIICVEVQEDAASTGEDYPMVQMPSARSLGETLINTTGLIKLVLRSLIDGKWINKQACQYLNSVGELNTQYFTYNNKMYKDLADAISIFSTDTTNTDELIELYAPIADFMVYNNFWNSVNKQKRAFSLIYNFEKYIDPATGEISLYEMLDDENCRVNESELLRLNDFLTSIKNKINDMYSDCNLYEISSGKDDNEAREVALNIGNNTYYVSFNKDTSNPLNMWSISITTIGDKGETSLNGLNGKAISTNSWPVCNSFSEMTPNTNCIFLDKTREYEVYLYYNKKAIGQTSITTKNYLCNYQLVVSYGHVRDHIQKIYDTIYNALIKEYYN